jgi:hypothetical protein
MRTVSLCMCVLLVLALCGCHAEYKYSAPPNDYVKTAREMAGKIADLKYAYHHAVQYDLESASGFSEKDLEKWSQELENAGKKLEEIEKLHKQLVERAKELKAKPFKEAPLTHQDAGV